MFNTKLKQDSLFEAFRSQRPYQHSETVMDVPPLSAGLRPDSIGRRSTSTADALSGDQLPGPAPEHYRRGTASISPPPAASNPSCCRLMSIYKTEHPCDFGTTIGKKGQRPILAATFQTLSAVPHQGLPGPSLDHAVKSDRFCLQYNIAEFGNLSFQVK